MPNTVNIFFSLKYKLPDWMTGYDLLPGRQIAGTSTAVDRFPEINLINMTVLFCI